MERGSDKQGPRVDDQVKHEEESLERAGKEAHVEGFRQDEAPTDVEPGEVEEPTPSGHRISGTGSSADTYPYRDHGEKGGASHPKPDRRSNDADQRK
ncbi:MAG: hypothetical protein M3285_11260 [Actinomycetota bacterium]|nr:hypothetical protein [Actinomycetota bacterium]